MCQSLASLLFVLLTLSIKIKKTTSFILPLPFFSPPSTSTTLYGSLQTKDFKTGLTLMIDQTPSKLISFSHVKQARGGASTKTKYRNLLTGGVLTKTIQAFETFDPASVDKREVTYSYSSDDSIHFMDNTTFEEYNVNAEMFDDKKKWLIEGMLLNVLVYNDKIIDIVLPPTYDYRILRTDPPMKTQTVTALSKSATLTSGAVVMVPGFIVEGEFVLCDLDNGKYMSRSKGMGFGSGGKGDN